MELLTVNEVARMLRMSPITVRRYVSAGRLPAVRIGRNVRIERAAAENLPVSEGPVKGMRHLARPTPGQSEPKFFSKSDVLWRMLGAVKDDANPADMSSDKRRYLS